jgi:hypothetical protein
LKLPRKSASAKLLLLVVRSASVNFDSELPLK